jgi:hypothetical protein
MEGWRDEGMEGWRDEGIEERRDGAERRSVNTDRK